MINKGCLKPLLSPQQGSGMRPPGQKNLALCHNKESNKQHRGLDLAFSLCPSYQLNFIQNNRPACRCVLCPGSHANENTDAVYQGHRTSITTIVIARHICK